MPPHFTSSLSCFSCFHVSLFALFQYPLLYFLCFVSISFAFFQYLLLYFNIFCFVSISFAFFQYLLLCFNIPCKFLLLVIKQNKKSRQAKNEDKDKYNLIDKKILIEGKNEHAKTPPTNWYLYFQLTRV